MMLDKKFDEIIAKHFSPLEESLETVKSSLNFLCGQYDELVKTVTASGPRSNFEIGGGGGAPLATQY